MPLNYHRHLSTLVQVAGLSSIRFGFIAFLLSGFPTSSHGEEQECCPFKTVENSAIEKFNGGYTLVNDSKARGDVCNDGCIYSRNGFEYCFVVKPGELLIRPLAYVVCEVGFRILRKYYVTQKFTGIA